MAALSGLTSVVLGRASAGTPANTAGVSGYGNPENNRQSLITDRYRENDFTIKFGDGSSTYPAGGIPLSATGVQATTIPGTSSTYGSGALAAAVSFGYRSELKQLDIFDSSNSDGYVYKFDKTNFKLRIYQVPASGSLGAAAALVEVTTGFAPANGVQLLGRAKGR